ncbi:MAG: hypothetical protein Q8P31_14220 [Bacillota bacterium]|nr:hypothetical protein [Bacillota bacterium]
MFFFSAPALLWGLGAGAVGLVAARWAGHRQPAAIALLTGLAVYAAVVLSSICFSPG